MLLPFREHPARSLRLACGKVNIWDGGFRTSKTVVSLSAFLTWLASDEAPRGDRCAFIGYTQESIAANVLPALQKLLGVGAVAHKQGEIRMLGRVFRVLGGATDKDQDRIAGMTLDAAYIDEASRLAESMWLMTFNRLSKAGARLYATTNPAGPGHWLYKLIVKPAGVWLAPDGTLRAGSNPDVVRMTLRPQDNPGVGPEYWEGLARVYRGAALRRAVNGEWIGEEGLIYPTLLDQVWAGELPPMSRYHLGIDPGAAHPLAAVMVGEGVDDRAYVLSEHWYDGATEGARSQAADVEAIGEWLYECELRWPGASRIRRAVVDPSALYFNAAMRDAGYPAVVGDNRVVPGIQWVNALLATDRLRLCPQAEHTIEESTGYAWDEKAVALGEDKPVKVNDDCPDALRYDCMDRFGAWRHWIGAELRDVA